MELFKNKKQKQKPHRNSIETKFIIPIVWFNSFILVRRSNLSVYICSLKTPIWKSVKIFSSRKPATIKSILYPSEILFATCNLAVWLRALYANEITPAGYISTSREFFKSFTNRYSRWRREARCNNVTPNPGNEHCAPVYSLKGLRDYGEIKL